MGNKARANQFVTKVASAMIAMALAMRILIPAGFMVGNAQNLADGIPIVLCTAQGNIDAIMNEDGSIETKSHSDDKSHDAGIEKSHQNCAFAFSNHHVSIASSVFVPAFFVNSEASHIISEAKPMVGKGLAAPPPPKTGPPSII